MSLLGDVRNRGNDRSAAFHKDDNFAERVKLVREPPDEVPQRLADS